MDSLTKHGTVIFAAICLSLLFSHTLLAASPSRFDDWPTHAWKATTPEEQGMDSGKLADMLKMICDLDLNVDSVTIVRNGYIVAEKYFSPYSENTRHVLYSCTKSFISALVGMAIEDGYIDSVNIAVQDFFPELTF